MADKVTEGGPAPATGVDNQLWVSWRDEAFGDVNLSNALSYFARSPFVNLEGPSVSNNKLTSSLSDSDLEYVVHDAQSPRLFVIRMQAKGVPLGLYYVLDRTVYACPSLHNVLSSRRKRCCHKVCGSLDFLRKDLNPIDGVLCSSSRVDMSQVIAGLEAAASEVRDTGRQDLKGDAMAGRIGVRKL